MLPVSLGLGVKQHLETSLSETVLGSLCRRLSTLFLFICIMGGISFVILFLASCWFHPYSDLQDFPEGKVFIVTFCNFASASSFS